MVIGHGIIYRWACITGKAVRLPIANMLLLIQECSPMTESRMGSVDHGEERSVNRA